MAVNSRVLSGRMSVEPVEKPVALNVTVKRLAGYLTEDKRYILFLFLFWAWSFVRSLFRHFRAEL